jgi:hypothetical protein
MHAVEAVAPAMKPEPVVEEKPKIAPEAPTETPRVVAPTPEASPVQGVETAPAVEVVAAPIAPTAPQNPSRPAAGKLQRRVPGGSSTQNAPQAGMPQPKTAASTSAPAAPKPVVKLDLPTAPALAAEPEAASAPSAAAVEAAPTPAPAKPRDVKPRDVKPRDFAAATITTASAAERLQAEPAPALTLAPDVPVDTRPIDKVNEELIASGIMAAAEGDTLTSSLPGRFNMGEEQTPIDAKTGNFTLATAPVPQPSLGSGLPWQTEPMGGWQVDMNTPAPPPDVFKPQGSAQGMGGQGLGAIPLLAESTSPRFAPPTLPETRPSRAAFAAAARGKSSWLGTGVTVLALGIIGFYVYNQSTQPGGLEQAKQQLAQFAEPGPRLAEVAGVSATNGLLPPPNLIAGGQGALGNVSGTGNTQIGFLDAPADPNAAITADGATPMPEDISLFAQLQKAIQEQRTAQGGTNPVSTTAAIAAIAAEGETPAEQPALTKEQVAAELAAYQKALNENPNNPPKPREFFRDPDAFMDGRAAGGAGDTAALPDGTLLPPPASRNEAARANGELPPPAELYTNNPNNLPIVAEPVGAQAPRIRQLQDFAAELMAPEQRSVKIPQGLRPRMAASDFPSLDVLSFVPGKGVVATADGREGVLLIGESINGWELTQVTQDVAEFRAGGRSYYVNAQN